MTTILKLGGSLVTEKDRERVLAEDRLAAACTAIAAADPADLVLVHGGGSFGHPAAERHGITTADGTGDPTGVRAVMEAMDDLNGAILAALDAAGVPGVGLAPRACAWKRADGDVELAIGAIEGWLEAGQVPVLFGDLVPHAGAGATVLSGDALAVALAEALDADRLGLCTDVPGVLDADGAVIPTIASRADAPTVFAGPDGTDVSGGMGGKVATLLGTEIPASIFALDALSAFLDGDAPGTTITGTAGRTDTDPF